jgi:hypothetical protein
MNLFSRIAEILDLPLDELMRLEIRVEDEPATILQEMHHCLAALQETAALASARCRLLRYDRPQISKLSRPCSCPRR